MLLLHVTLSLLFTLSFIWCRFLHSSQEHILAYCCCSLLFAFLQESAVLSGGWLADCCAKAAACRLCVGSSEVWQWFCRVLWVLSLPEFCAV